MHSLMCIDCAIHTIIDSDDLRWPELTGLMVETARLIDEFYGWYLTGGPLHIVTDDSNIDDSNLAYCWGAVFEDGWWRDDATPEEIEADRGVAAAILWGLGAMTEVERAVTVVLDEIGVASYPPDVDFESAWWERRVSDRRWAAGEMRRATG